MEIAKLLIVKGILWIPLTVYLVLYKLPEFVEFFERRNEAKLRREREKAERKKREEENRWRGLIEEIGYHRVSVKNVIEDKPLLYPKEFKNQRNRIIRALEGYGSSVPSEEDLLAKNFNEYWFKFLDEGFREVAQLHYNGPPTEEKFLKLWDEYKPR